MEKKIGSEKGNMSRIEQNMGRRGVKEAILQTDASVFATATAATVASSDLLPT